MKRVWMVLVFICLMFVMASCSGGKKNSFDIYSIQSYKEIPDITQAEIAAIEAIKSEKTDFSYGYILSPESFRKTDGSAAGFAIEVCKLLSRLFGIQFEPEEYTEWSELKSDIDNCDTDFSGEFTCTAERMEIYQMTTPIAGRGLNAYYLASSPEIRTEADLNGMRVGFAAGTVTSELVFELYPDSDFEFVEIIGFSDAVEKLSSGEIGAFVAESTADLVMLDEHDNIRSKKIFQFVYSPVSITTMDISLQPIISVVNKYLDAGGMMYISDLYRDGNREYKKHKLSQSFTADELVYLANLAQSGTGVNIALQHDAYPASFYNSVEKRYDGAAYDIIKEVSALTDIVFNSDCMPVEKALTDILAKLKSGEVSMMPQLLYSESRKDDYIWSNVSYITTKYAMLSKSSFPTLEPFQVYYTKVGTINRSAHEELFKAYFPDHKKTLVYQTGDEGFDALERGEIDLLMLSETMLLVQTNYREKLGYKINLSFDKTLDTLFGFNKDEVVLRDIFDKTLAYIDISGIEEEWLNKAFDYQGEILRYRSKLFEDLTPVVVIFFLLLFAVLCIVFALYGKNRRISKNLELTVKARTSELELRTTTLATIYKSIPDLVFCKDPNGIYTSCNSSYEKHVGISEADIIGKSDFEIYKLDEDIAKLYVEADKKVLNNQDMGAIEEVIPSADGKRRYFETYKTPLIQNDEVIGMMGISRDITDRKASEDVLEKQLKQQNFMATLSQSFIGDGNIDEQITESLGLVGEFMGISRVLLMKFADKKIHYVYEWVNPSQDIKPKAGSVLPIADDELEILSVISQRKLRHFNLDDIGPDAVMRRYRVEDVKNFLMLPVFVGDKIWGALDFSQCKEYTPWTMSDINLGELVAGVLSGVMKRQNVEDKLVEAKEVAEQNNKAKSDFLSRMSHEMRTPMNAIIGMTNIGKNSSDIERKNYCLGKIDSASTHLLGVINDVLDISKIEAGKFELSNTDFNLEKMLIRITNVVNFRMEEKGQRFIIKVGNDVPQAIFADEQRLSQVITNLIGNAVKFTPDNGTISLFVDKIAEENGIYTLQFDVKDTGIGISEEQQKKLFTSFEQGDGSVSRKYGGTGLGLAISKHIIEMMDGKVWLESKVGEGSMFSFSIRAQKGVCQAGLLRTDINWSDLRILAVDDDLDVLEYFISMANSFGLKCETAASGADACAIIEKYGAFDIFFVDWKMPGMDGIELTKWIKGKYTENSIVIMISGTEWSYIEVEAKQAGVDLFIPKPLFSSVIIECIQDCVSTRQTEEVADNSGHEDECFKGKRILLAEDVDINREIVISLLEHTGIRIDCAADGGIAYKMFKDYPDYDMIFMDVHMPEVDGYASTRMIRAFDDPRAKTVPIIAMTANVFREDVEKCLNSGMNAHIGKPIDIEDVMAKLNQYLQKDRRKQ